MKKLLLILLLSKTLIYGQQPLFEKIATQVCDSLSISKFENIDAEKGNSLVINIIKENYADWRKNLHQYTKETGQSAYNFNNYFEHILLQDCKKYRIIDSKSDPYLKNKENLRALYNEVKKFVYKLEDNVKNKDLKQQLSDSLNKQIVDQFLDKIKKEVRQYKRISNLSIILVYDNGYTFRVRYFDYKTDLPLFQADIIFNNDSDMLIDEIKIKERNQLLKELKEHIEFNKKVDKGEIKLPPPPLPPQK